MLAGDIIIAAGDSLYDTPRSTKVLELSGLYDSPRASSVYDVPKSSQAEEPGGLYDTPPPSRAVSTVSSQGSGLHYTVQTNGRTDIYSRPSLREVFPFFLLFSNAKE